MLTFSRTQRDAHACLHGQTVVVRLPEADPVQVDVARSPLRGPHNEENLLAAVLAGAALGISAAAMQAVVERARGLPHRLEWVRRWHGVDFYDDSKGTNVGAVVRALENFDRPVVLLVGGRDKRGSYEPLVAAVRPRVKALFVYGEAGPRLYEAFRGTVPTQRLADLAGAFQAAVAEMRPGDVVLLSPACSSFDQYESYAQRGEHFKRLVGALTGP
jgi:UDP-N-acetylmuramoylalanine--D-glutamate ligase